MSTLIVYLPPGPVSTTTEFDYVLTHNGQSIAAQGRSRAALLPNEKLGHIVAVAPVQVLSWHTVTLPKGSLSARGTSRLRAVLDGLLEERLLDEPQALHFALAPGAQVEQPAWVAACDRAWLTDALHALEGPGREVSRVVPELMPSAPGAFPAAWVLGSNDQAQWVRADDSGITILPLDAGSIALANLAAESGQPRDHGLALLTDPAAARLAERWFKRPAELQPSAQRWLLAAQSGWDLAQFDLTRSGRTRIARKLTQTWTTLLHASQWSAVRWGAGLLVIVQLLGLNLWAWREKAALQTQRTAITGILTRTFPGVRVVVDAPLQMERELAALRQATGATSPADLEAMLAAVGSALPAGASPTAIEFSSGEARLKGLSLKPDEAATLKTRLNDLHYSARTQGDALILQAEGRP